MKISINALAGVWKHKTIRVPAMIKGRRVSILIDSGSTYSLIDERLVGELNYAIDETKTMTVRVTSRDKLDSKFILKQLIWKVHDWKFQYKLGTLKLGGSDMVLGVNWISQVGPIIFDFIQGYVKFKYNQEEIKLRR